MFMLVLAFVFVLVLAFVFVLVFEFEFSIECLCGVLTICPSTFDVSAKKLAIELAVAFLCTVDVCCCHSNTQDDGG